MRMKSTTIEMTSDRESRAVASILGGAIGDALGVTKEMLPKSDTADGMHFDVPGQRIFFHTIQRYYEGGG